MRPLCWLQMSETDYPVTLSHIPKEHKFSYLLLVTCVPNVTHFLELHQLLFHHNFTVNTATNGQT